MSTNRALIVGHEGGVGRTVTWLLANHPVGKRIASSFERVFLVDAEPPSGPNSTPFTVLPPTRIAQADDLGRLIQAHGITQVIDLSSVDTVECTTICDELGADFLSTSVEEWPGQVSIPTDEAISKLLPPKRPFLIRRGHLVGSGANPGIVNALVFAAMKAFADRLDLPPQLEALDLYGVFITEEDTTRDPDATFDPDVFPMTWSPAHCLEELYEPRAFAARGGKVVDLGHGPTERFYRARCGDRLIDAFAVPHEETATLAWRMPGVESAFLYRIAEDARAALRAHPERRSADEWKTKKLYPPAVKTLEGGDRVGVLLCSRSHGELWMGFETPAARGLPMGSNGTELQVAAGVLAGMAQLGERKGIHLVEDLDWRAFLDVAAGVLGEPHVVYDADAPYLPLADRLVEDEPLRRAMTA